MVMPPLHMDLALHREVESMEGQHQISALMLQTTSLSKSLRDLLQCSHRVQFGHPRVPRWLLTLSEGPEARGPLEGDDLL
jgi:hypothetical protein